MLSLDDFWFKMFGFSKKGLKRLNLGLRGYKNAVLFSYVSLQVKPERYEPKPMMAKPNWHGQLLTILRHARRMLCSYRYLGTGAWLCTLAAPNQWPRNSSTSRSGRAVDSSAAQLTKQETVTFEHSFLIVGFHLFL